jgi:uncharacterized membrane protein YphA (DoxX/SURF4 family)
LQPSRNERERRSPALRLTPRVALPSIDARYAADYIAASFTICAKENPIGSDYAGDGERGGAPGDSRLAHVGQRYQQCSPLAESGEYREYFVPKGATFFGFVATILMVLGGFGLAAGIQTPICAVMIMIFLIPTFALHWHWLKILPTMSPAVKAAITDDKAQNYFRSFDRQAFHAHEVGIRDNLVFLMAALYFAVCGSAAFGVDNWLPNWVIWLF